MLSTIQITISTGEVLTKLNTLWFHWIVIYPVDSVIHPLNKSARWLKLGDIEVDCKYRNLIFVLQG